MLVGLCGAQGSGKTTVAKILTEKVFFKEDMAKPKLIEPKSFVLNELNLSKDQIKPLMQKYIDPEWSWEWCSHFLPISNEKTGSWSEISLADPLKRVSSILFNYPYHILLGETSETRDIRERLTTASYTISGPMTGRKLLQFFGTEMIRENLGGDFWPNLAEKTITRMRSQGKNVILPDIRFPEEREMIKKLRGKLVLIQRDGVKTNHGHASEAHWQKFDYDSVIDNNGTVNELKNSIGASLQQYFQVQQ